MLYKQVNKHGNPCVRGAIWSIIAVILLVGTSAVFMTADASTSSYPSRPQNVQIVSGVDKVTLTWEAPSHPGMGLDNELLTISHYEIRWRLSTDTATVNNEEEARWRSYANLNSIAADSTSFELTGTYPARVIGGYFSWDAHTIAYGNTYHIQIRAISIDEDDQEHRERPSHYVDASGTPEAALPEGAPTSALSIALHEQSNTGSKSDTTTNINKMSDDVSTPAENIVFKVSSDDSDPFGKKDDQLWLLSSLMETTSCPAKPASLDSWDEFDAWRDASSLWYHDQKVIDSNNRLSKTFSKQSEYLIGSILSLTRGSSGDVMPRQIPDGTYCFFVVYVSSANGTLPILSSIGSTTVTIDTIAKPTITLNTTDYTVTTPEFTVGNLEVGATAELFSDASCSASVSDESAAVADGASTVTITTSTLTLDPKTTIYAKTTDTVGNTACSSEGIVYPPEVSEPEETTIAEQLVVDTTEEDDNQAATEAETTVVTAHEGGGNGGGGNGGGNQPTTVVPTVEVVPTVDDSDDPTIGTVTTDATTDGTMIGGIRHLDAGDVLTVKVTVDGTGSDIVRAPKVLVRFGDGEEREMTFVSSDADTYTYTYTVDQYGDNGVLSYRVADVEDAGGNTVSQTAFTEVTDMYADVYDNDHSRARNSKSLAVLETLKKHIDWLVRAYLTLNPRTPCDTLEYLKENDKDSIVRNLADVKHGRRSAANQC